MVGCFLSRARPAADGYYFPEGGALLVTLLAVLFLTQSLSPFSLGGDTSESPPRYSALRVFDFLDERLTRAGYPLRFWQVWLVSSLILPAVRLPFFTGPAAFFPSLERPSIPPCFCFHFLN